MENKEMKKYYMISRWILVGITFILFKIMFINEDSSWWIVAFIFSLIAFLVSFPSTIISKTSIKIGNRLDKSVLKILYYAIILPALAVFLVCGCYYIMIFIYDIFSIPDDFVAALGQALLFLFLIVVVAICIIVPYIQTLLVLFLRRLIKRQ